MQRDPRQQYINQHLKSIRIKTIKPLFLYEKCCKCSMEYKRERMYECSFQNAFIDQTNYVQGCSHCFESAEDFRKYLEDNDILYTEESLSDTKEWFRKQMGLYPEN